MAPPALQNHVANAVRVPRDLDWSSRNGKTLYSSIVQLSTYLSVLLKQSMFTFIIFS